MTPHKSASDVATPIRSARSSHAAVPAAAAGASVGLVALSLVVVGLGAVGFGVTSINTETVVSSAFDRTFAALVRPAGPVGRARAYDGVSGSEDFWLSAKVDGHFVKAVSVGQNVLLTTNGSSRELTITDVRALADEATHIDTGGAGSKVLLVTCQEKGGSTQHQLRLRIEHGHLVEAPASQAQAAEPSARAL